MNKTRIILAMVMLCALADAVHAAAPQQEVGVERFFADCPHRPRRRLHRDGRLYDLHTITYSAANLMEVEVLRLADWLIDLAVPGVHLQPLEWTVEGLRDTYNRLGHARPLARIGEFVDALQIPELSLGDAAVTYSVGTDGAVSPGSGTLVRLNKFVDWTQHVVADVDGMLGWPVGRRAGLLGWRWPGRVVDGAQAIVHAAFHGVGVMLAKGLDGTVRGLEHVLEGAVNINRPTPHAQTAVFVRMPLGVYRAHELWILRHRTRIYVGTAEHLAHVTHADLFHPRRGRRLAWWAREHWKGEPEAVILVTDQRTFAQAPRSFMAYAVPASWALRSSAD